jgi:beta-glucanase (GH16 family)
VRLSEGGLICADLAFRCRDWLWPAVWMLPQDSVYGPWPLSGEIDVSTWCLVLPHTNPPQN